MVNPDVRVTYKHQYFFESKYYIPSFKHIFGYFVLYFVGLTRKRNKYMSNYKTEQIKINSILYNWYLKFFGMHFLKFKGENEFSHSPLAT